MFKHIKVLSFTHFLQGPSALQMLARPVRYDGQAPALRRPPPAIGEHTREILAQYGLSHEQIERLVADGLVKDGSQVQGKRDAAD